MFIQKHETYKNFTTDMFLGFVIAERLIVPLNLSSIGPIVCCPLPVTIFVEPDTSTVLFEKNTAGGD